MKKFAALSLVAGVGLGAVGAQVLRPVPPNTIAEKDRIYTDKVHVVGHMRRADGAVYLQMSDGRIIRPKLLLFKTAGTFDAEIEPGVWVRGTM